MKQLFIVIFSLCLSISSIGQLYPFYKNYTWEKNPKAIERPKTDHLYYYNRYYLVVEYEYDYYAQQFYKIETLHYRVKLNSDAAIEEFNKIYINMEDVVKIHDVKARIIKPNKVTEAVIKMEEFYSEEDADQYRYFAVSGIELGDELEVIYTLVNDPLLNGDQFNFQGTIPIYNFDFKFIVPNDAYFKFLAHNGLPTPILRDTIIQRHQYDIHLDTIPAVKDEYFVEYSNISMKLDASLSSVNGSLAANHEPYLPYTEYVNELFNQPLGAKSLKSVKILNQRLGVNRSNSIENNIRLIENYMKNEFLLGYGTPNMSIEEMIEKGKGDGTGSINLFLALLSDANIKCEIGMTSNRYETYFSKEIDSEFFLQNYFIYFPEINKYLAPLDFNSRLGYLNHKWVPNNGIYLTSKQVPVRETEYEVRPIKGTTYKENVDSTVITINVSKDFTNPKITILKYLMGYDAGEHQLYYQFYSEAKRKEIHDELLNVFKDNSTYKLTKIENVLAEDAFIKPLILTGEVKTLYAPLFERAGSKMIFKLGEIIGEYLDPKEIAKKKYDYVFANPFTRTVTIIVNFEEPVTISNLETVPVFEKFGNLEATDMSSSVKVSEKQFIYSQRDIYKSSYYPKSDEEELMKIFTMHSDLFKLNLVIE
jgi:hypothetical protein